MSLESSLLNRSHSKCELCTSDKNLIAYIVPPREVASIENSILICEKCQGLLASPESEVNHWRCLNESMWSEFPAVQVMAWRLLKKISTQDWARDLSDLLFLDDETLEWAQMMNSTDTQTELDTPTKDSNGSILIDGDSVTLIKDLEVKGANFTAKRGTLVKNITLTANPEHIEGRVNGTHIVLLTCFLKKV